MVLLVGAVIAILLIAREPSAPQDMHEVTLMLDWTPNVNHIGIYVAQQEQFFAREGLNVQIIQPGEVFAAAAVLSGVADFGIDFQEYLTLLSADQPGLVSIAAILQSNTSGLATRSADAIGGIAALNKKRYGTFQSPFEQPTIEALLACEGVTNADIEYIPAGNDLLAMLSADQIDFTWIFWGTQGFQAQRLGIAIDYFPLSDYQSCIPDYYSPIVIASEELLQNRPELARAFLRALRNAHEFVVKNPSQAAAMLHEAVPELDQTELELSAAWLSQYMLHPTEGWGYQEYSRWEEYARWMQERAIIDNLPVIDELYTNQYLE